MAQADTRGASTSLATALDKAIISFNASDRLEKFVFGKTDAKIYIPQGGKEYAIATVGRDGVHTVCTNEMPLSFKAEKNDTYTLSVNVENIELDYLHLIDNMTGADIDLLTPAGFPLCKGGQGDSIPPLRGGQGESINPATPSYSFTAKTTDYASRFRLMFSANAASGDACEPSFAYVSDGNIVITADARDASLQIVDAIGRVIRCTDIARNVSTHGMAPGVYVLRLINGDEVKTQKIVID